MQSYYVGTDLKFKLDIDCVGFSMADDEFFVTLIQSNRRVDISKSQMVQSEDGGYYFMVDSTQFKPGVIKMIVTAYVPDDDFDGYRREVTVTNLCNIRGTV